MKMKLKKVFSKAYLMQFLIVIVILFNIFVLNTYRLNNWYPTLYWIVLAVISYFIFGLRNRIPNKFVDVMQLVFIYCMGYELITYLSGLVLGFVRSPYSMDLVTMIKNIAPILVMIVAQEVLRYAVISRYKKEKVVIASITLAIILYEISYGVGAYNLKSPAEIVKMITILVGGSITKNALCSYLAYRADYKPAILYRCIFELIIYVVPIYPNLGEYIEAMVSMIFPILLLVSIIALFEKKKYRQPKKSVKEIIILWTPAVIVMLIIVTLQTGVFRYRSMAIGSQSMYPNISKGDVVIIDQFKNEERCKDVVVGEVLVFKHNNIIIVHRVTDIKERNGRLIFNTKGDNNNSADVYDIDQSQVVGVAKFKIPLIGMPSVWLSETVNG